MGKLFGEALSPVSLLLVYSLEPLVLPTLPPEVIPLEALSSYKEPVGFAL